MAGRQAWPARGARQPAQPADSPPPSALLSPRPAAPLSPLTSTSWIGTCALSKRWRTWESRASVSSSWSPCSRLQGKRREHQWRACKVGAAARQPDWGQHATPPAAPPACQRSPAPVHAHPRLDTLCSSIERWLGRWSMDIRKRRVPPSGASSSMPLPTRPSTLIDPIDASAASCGGRRHGRGGGRARRQAGALVSGWGSYCSARKGSTARQPATRRARPAPRAPRPPPHGGPGSAPSTCAQTCFVIGGDRGEKEEEVWW